MRIVAFSDTHMQHNAITMPVGDVLIFAGDMCRLGMLDEVREFNRYLASLPHPHKIVVAGNHDWPFEYNPLQARNMLTAADYLQDQGIEIAGFKIYGSPWQPEFHAWAFNLPRGACLKQKWDKIPLDTDILVTHAPPAMMLDKILNQERVGCEMLKIAVEQTVKPKVHIFGHIHESYGIVEKAGTTYVNASICDYNGAGFNSPIVLDV
jgi:Icc-related predicted phosphoesterase